MIHIFLQLGIIVFGIVVGFYIALFVVSRIFGDRDITDIFKNL